MIPINSEVELNEILTTIARRLCPGWMDPTCHANYCDVKRALKQAYEMGRLEPGQPTRRVLSAEVLYNGVYDGNRE